VLSQSSSDTGEYGIYFHPSSNSWLGLYVTISSVFACAMLPCTRAMDDESCVSMFFPRVHVCRMLISAFTPLLWPVCTPSGSNYDGNITFDLAGLAPCYRFDAFSWISVFHASGT